MSWRFFDCSADSVGQLNGNGQKGTLQIDAPSVENFRLRHSIGLLGRADPRRVPLLSGSAGLLELESGMRRTVT